MTEFDRGDCYQDDRGTMSVLIDEDDHLARAEQTSDTERERWISWRVAKNKFSQWEVSENGQVTNEEKMSKIRRLCAADPNRINQ
jgi:hypothetical protein